MRGFVRLRENRFYGSMLYNFFAVKGWGPLKMEIGRGPLGITLPDSPLLRHWMLLIGYGFKGGTSTPVCDLF